MWTRFSDKLLKEISSKKYKAELLNLSEQDLNEEDVKLLVANLNANANITKLCLAECILTDDQAILLKDLKNITDLDVSENALSDVGARALATLPLKKLNVSLNLIHDGKPFTESKTLTELDLSDNAISEDVANMLLQHPNLKKLNLAGNQAITGKTYAALDKKFGEANSGSLANNPSTLFKNKGDEDLPSAAFTLKQSPKYI